MLRLRRVAIANRRAVPIEQAGRSDRGHAARWRIAASGRAAAVAGGAAARPGALDRQKGLVHPLMAHCVQTTIVDAPCASCGGRAEKMHQPIFQRGTYCPKCCPACKTKDDAPPKPAPKLRGVVPAAAVARRDQPAARGATQWKDAGWGHRPDDPWVHDRDRHQSRPRWIPSRPNWFRRKT